MTSSKKCATIFSALRIMRVPSFSWFLFQETDIRQVKPSISSLEAMPIQLLELLSNGVQLKMDLRKATSIATWD